MVTHAGSERTVEIPYVLKVMKQIMPANVLDVGSAGSWYLSQITDLGIEYTGLDSDLGRINGNTLLVGEQQKQEWRHLLTLAKYIIADITKYPSGKDGYNVFDAVISVSTIEHIIPCGYQNDCEGDMEADFKAVANMKKLTKSGGILILTFPCGQEQFFYNTSHNKNTGFDYSMFTAGKYDLIVYGKERVFRLIDNWSIMDLKFWTRQGGITSDFVECDMDEAFNKVPTIKIPTQSVCAVTMVSP